MGSGVESKERGLGKTLTHQPVGSLGSAGVSKHLATCSVAFLSAGAPALSRCMTGTDKDHPSQLPANLHYQATCSARSKSRLLSPVALVGAPKSILLGDTGHSWTHLVVTKKSSLKGVKLRGGDRPSAYEQAEGRLCPLRFPYL